jgi:hypothetical protein
MPAQVDKAAEARRWKKELQLAGKREKDWRDEAEKVVKRYRGEEKKRNRYNVLWATTETLRPAVYNSKPNPDVRRRFRDSDPLGKAVGEVLERSLFVMFDSDEPDAAIRNDVLDGLLSGRGVSRIKYVPKLSQSGTAPAKPKVESEDIGGSEPHEDDEGSYEQVEYEQTCLEHVDWRDYRQGYGRTWDEVPWNGFRHKMIRSDAESKFGKEAVATITFAQPNTDDPKKPTEEAGETQKVAEFWEIWDKLGQRVFFIQEDLEQLLFPLDNPDGSPPLDFEGFFCCPEPLKMIENTGSQIPIIPFTLYENQANELDKISVRIDRIVNVCRLRGIYDSKLPEIPDLLAGDDNELTPVQNAQQWSDKGLDAAIAWMPVEKLQAVLATLYDAREKQLAIIDQLTGVSDIVRGATDPNETATAQQIKSNYHSLRLGRMQGEVKRYVKDLMRLASQVMSSKFAAETFAAMTDLKFPTPQEKQELQIKAQMLAQQPQVPGQPPPQPPPELVQALQVPTWEDILGMMHSPALRQFRVDVETDSTIAAMLDSDMTALSALLKAISQMLMELAPLVQSGALPVEAAKEIVMAVIRRARLGTAVEDAFDKMQMPKPPPQPQDHAIEVAQINAASHEKIEGAKLQAAGQTAQIEQAAQAQQRQAELEMELRRTQLEADIEIRKDAQEKQHELSLKTAEHDLEFRKLAAQLENERLIADANNQTKIMVAEIAAKAQQAAAAMTAANYEKEEEGVDA